MSEYLANEMASNTQPQSQEGNDTTEDYSQLLSEGHVYDNEDLVVARLNAAYVTAGMTTTHLTYHQTSITISPNIYHITSIMHSHLSPNLPSTI